MVNNGKISNNIQKNINLSNVTIPITFALQNGLNGDLCELLILFRLKSMMLNNNEINFVLVCVAYCYNKYK